VKPKITHTRHVIRKARGVEAAAEVTASHEAPRSSGRHGATAHAAASTGNPANSPCRLVTKAEAEAIVGKPLKVTQAPQGPTCIYRRSSKAQVALSVQKIDFADIRKAGRIVSQQRAGKRTIYCVKYGATGTYVPLSGHRVLNITGACATGARFARKALSRL
jgi:hypothetical protein